ncbi:MAG: 50S ribosomal protein L9 [Firmicutes bacterium]|nr:50S ribosomal protein L9 [Bacillota bacterium]
MKVILLQEVPKLGSAGDVVNVADGYARNYLIPRKMAEAATQSRLKELAQRQEKQERIEQQNLAQAQNAASKMKDLTLKIKAKAGEGGRLFGSITNADIADLLGKEGFTVDKKKIDLEEPIKSVGDFVVNIKLHREVTVPVKIQVEPE